MKIIEKIIQYSFKHNIDIEIYDVNICFITKGNKTYENDLRELLSHLKKDSDLMKIFVHKIKNEQRNQIINEILE